MTKKKTVNDVNGVSAERTSLVSPNSSAENWKQEIIKKTWKWYQDSDIWYNALSEEPFAKHALDLAEEHFKEKCSWCDRTNNEHIIQEKDKEISRLKAEKEELRNKIAKTEDFYDKLLKGDLVSKTWKIEDIYDIKEASV